MFSTKRILSILVLSFFISFTFSCGDDDSSDADPDIAIGDDDSDEGDDSEDSDEGDDNDGDDDSDGDDDDSSSCSETQSAVFIEEDGIVTVESESSDFEDTEWSLEQSISDFSGKGYLVWTGETDSNSPGVNGLLSYKIRISTPGTYRFIWRSRITIGDEIGEYNDSWLRIPDADHFYGMRNDGHIVYPKGTMLDPIPESAGQASTQPDGSGSDGWFKAYMNTVGSWRWTTRTSDNDAHDIYVVFDNPGDYTIEVSGRSMGHGIDKFVLFTDDTSVSDATSDDNIASAFECD